MRRTLPAALLVAALSSFRPCGAEEPVAVRIDDTIEITRSDLNTFVDAMLRAQRVPPQQMEAQRTQLWDRAIEQLVVQKLLLRAADAQKVAIDEGEVDAFFAEHLPQGVTVADVAQREGVSAEKLVAEIRNNLRIQKHLEAKVAAVPAPTDSEIQTFFEERMNRQPGYADLPEEVEARHILIRVDAGADEAARTAARTRIEGLRSQITEEGADFAALAAEHSDCPSGKRNGGNLGSFQRGQMVGPFEEAAFTQKPGVVGDVIETDFGFHIVEVLKKTEAGKRTLESEREELVEGLSRRKKGEAAGIYIEGLKDAAKIEVLEPNPPSDAAPAAAEIPAVEAPAVAVPAPQP